jgi:hypothetical protein
METSYVKTPEEIINQYADQWLKQEGIVAIGQGMKNNAPCIHLYTNETLSDTLAIPSQVEGYPIAVIKTDNIRAQQSP